jgi:hypothetical protein
MVWKRLAARGGEKIPERAAIETRDIDLESGPIRRGAGIGFFRAGHSPTSASEPRALAAHSFSTHRDRASADRRPFGPGTPALPQENVCAASRVTCGVTCRSKAHVSGRKQANPGD